MRYTLIIEVDILAMVFLQVTIIPWYNVLKHSYANTPKHCVKYTLFYRLLLIKKSNKTKTIWGVEPNQAKLSKTIGRCTKLYIIFTIKFDNTIDLPPLKFLKELHNHLSP